MSHNANQTILQFGDPLGFKIQPGTARAPTISGTGSDIFKVEARALNGHQKEAVLTEGKTGSIWRIASDEGTVMKGDDLAPFPLGFFNVGAMSDIYNRLTKIAAQSGVSFTDMRIKMSQIYGSDGSFIHSTAQAFAEGSNFKIELNGKIKPEDAKTLVKQAVDASPAMSLLRAPMTQNTFALYINGRRRKVIDHQNSVAEDALDPYLAYASPPRPHADETRDDLIVKSDVTETGETTNIPLTNTSKRLFAIDALGAPRNNSAEFETDTWIARPGMSHFKMVSDETTADTAPSGLGLMSAGIGFCYLTQLLRYVDAQKLNIHSPRLVQFTPFTSGDKGHAGAIDTHLFLSGDAPDETHLNLLTIAARTCFMHVAAATQTDPKIELIVNGQPVA